MSERTRTSARTLLPGLAGRYGAYDSEVFSLHSLRETDPEQLSRDLGISVETAQLVQRADHGEFAQAVRSLLAEHPERFEEAGRLYSRAWSAAESPLHIVDVTVAEPVLSEHAFVLDVAVQSPDGSRPVLARVDVEWDGDPFTVEQPVDESGADGVLRVLFDEEHALPAGPATFRLTVFREDGAQALFRRSLFVLPADRLSLRLSPAGARVTGTWSARGDYLPASDTFRTRYEITLANGAAWAVPMDRRVEWEFWNGGVGTGSLLESGSFPWPDAITIGPSGTWRGGVETTSPRNSPVFDAYDAKEDLTIAVRMRSATGRSVQGELTARVMLAFGVNVIKVGTFGAQEGRDLYAAVDRMRQIFERRDITLRGVSRRIIPAAQAGGYPTTDSEDEFRDMLEDWSCPNDFIDLYVVQDFQWGGFNGYAGDVPGPAAKGGRTDGVAVDKTGYTDATGTLRLSTETLAQLIGHEVGHYLGLEHLEDANNLMRRNTGVRGPELTYDQYRRMFPHGYLFYE